MTLMRRNAAAGLPSHDVDELKQRLIDVWHGFQESEKGTLQKVTERLYFVYSQEIPHPTKFNQNWQMSHTNFCYDRSREYKVTEGKMLPCSIGMACRHDCDTCDEKLISTVRYVTLRFFPS